MTSQRGTLLIFWRGSAAEQRAKRLLPATHTGLERRLHQVGLARLVAAGHAAGLQVALSSPEPVADLDDRVIWIQQPARGTFGLRLDHAIRRACPRGGPLLVAPADVPGLDAAVLDQAFVALAEDDVVVGPSPDGGIYLLGLQQPGRADLTMIRWCSAHAEADLRRVVEAAGASVARLPPRRDLDCRRDLEQALAARAFADFGSQLERCLRHALAPTTHPAEPGVRPGRPWIDSIGRLRGPPTAHLG
jgi:glycosyltransferase A (GT-A) superfamily protein (DUF2064 family)